MTVNVACTFHENQPLGSQDVGTHNHPQTYFTFLMVKPKEISCAINNTLRE